MKKSNPYVGQFSENYRQRLIAEGVKPAAAERFAYWYAKLVNLRSPREAEKLLRPQIMRTLMLQALDALEPEFAEKNPRTPSEDVRAAFGAARALVHARPGVSEGECVREIQRVLWLRRRARKSPLAAALLEAQLVKE